VRVQDELLGRALIEVLVSLRGFVERDHGGVDRLGDLRLVVEDHLHQAVVVLHHRAPTRRRVRRRRPDRAGARDMHSRARHDAGGARAVVAGREDVRQHRQVEMFSIARSLSGSGNRFQSGFTFRQTPGRSRDTHLRSAACGSFRPTLAGFARGPLFSSNVALRPQR